MDINNVVAELVSKQVAGAWAGQQAIAYHVNGKIKTNIRLDVYDTSDASYINGYFTMHVEEQATSLAQAVVEAHAFDEPVVLEAYNHYS